jgi:hypothetical protein
MAEHYALGSDEGLFPTVKLGLLSSYEHNGENYTDLTLTAEAYEKLKEHFRKVLSEGK